MPAQGPWFSIDTSAQVAQKSRYGENARRVRLPPSRTPPGHPNLNSMTAAIPDFGWFLIVGTIGATLLAILHIFASVVRNATYLHDVRVGVAELQARYEQQLRELEELSEPAPPRARTTEQPRDPGGVSEDDPQAAVPAPDTPETPEPAQTTSTDPAVPARQAA